MAEYRFTHTAVTRNPAHSLVAAVARKAALPSYGEAWLDELYQMGYGKVSVTALEAHVGARPGEIDVWGKQNKAAWDAYKAGRKARDTDDLEDVEEALRMGAVGYTIREDKVGPGGSVATVDKHVPPDTGAGLKWLERRDAPRWADKQAAGKAIMQVERLTVVNQYLSQAVAAYDSPFTVAESVPAVPAEPASGGSE